MITRRIIQLALSAVLMIAVFPPLSQVKSPAVFAANGDPVQATYFDTACTSGIGVGIAFDGEFLWYSCFQTGEFPDLYKAEALTGVVVDSFTVAGGLGALAWDGSRKKIWAGWGGGSGAEGDVRIIDPADGSATIEFNAADAVNGYDIDDGLAYDAQDDSLLISADVSQTIYQYSTSGALLDSFTWAGDACFNSGLAIGGDLLFQGANGCNHVWVVLRSDLSPAFDFDTAVTGDANFRDEDLECDSVTFSPTTAMWSVEAYEPRRAVAFEIPPGSCATGGGVDSDGDGLLDEWETDGITIDPDGQGPVAPQFTDLPAMGADPEKPDVFLHIDWMEDGTHSHALDQDGIRRVVESFANSPYTSPTGSVGINFHVDQGPASILDFSTNTTWGSLSRARALTHVNNLGTISGGNYDWSAFQTIKDEPGGFTESGRTPIFHYIISAHNYGGTTSSGISRGISASDLIVSLGSFTGGVGTEEQQAGTLMHELGHNLNLRHGGGDNVNFKPNYLSVMNYSFQLGGVIAGGVAGTFDYSSAALPNLNEANLNEPTGLGASAAGFGTRSFCSGTGFVPYANANGPMDWNCDGDSTDAGVAYDTNNNGSNADSLASYDDWDNLQLKGGAIGLAGVSPDLPEETEPDLLTVELAEQIIDLTTMIFMPVIAKTSP